MTYHNLLKQNPGLQVLGIMTSMENYRLAERQYSESINFKTVFSKGHHVIKVRWMAPIETELLK